MIKLLEDNSLKANLANDKTLNEHSLNLYFRKHLMMMMIMVMGHECMWWTLWGHQQGRGREKNKLMRG
jgi:hypothetical protein